MTSRKCLRCRESSVAAPEGVAAGLFLSMAAIATVPEVKRVALWYNKLDCCFTDKDCAGSSETG